MDELTLTFNSPLTEEDWDVLEDVDFDRTNIVWFHTKHGKDVEFVKVVRCGECKHRYVDGDNVRFNVCELNHNKVQSDEWFCADGERRADEAN